jgi:hypothetical protein
MSDYEKVEKHFLSQARKGIILNLKDLKTYCSKRRLSFSVDKLKHLRRKWKFTAIFSRTRNPTQYFSQAIMRYGVLQVDFGFFGKPVRGESRREKKMFLLNMCFFFDSQEPFCLLLNA